MEWFSKMVGNKARSWDGFVSTAEEIGGTALKKDEDNVTKASYWKDEKNHKDERKKSTMKERGKLRK